MSRSRSRSPHMRTQELNEPEYVFINFTTHRFQRIELLKNKKVQAARGGPHGSWELRADGGFTIDWHFRGFEHQTREHKYVPIAHTRAFELFEVDEIRSSDVTFLLPVEPGIKRDSYDFIYHGQSGQQAFKSMSMRESGDVVYNNGAPHGSWRHDDNDGAIVATWNHTGRNEANVDHRFYKVPHTNAWRLFYRDGRSIQDATLMLPKVSYS